MAERPWLCLKAFRLISELVIKSSCEIPWISRKRVAVEVRSCFILSVHFLLGIGKSNPLKRISVLFRGVLWELCCSHSIIMLLPSQSLVHQRLKWHESAKTENWPALLCRFFYNGAVQEQMLNTYVKCVYMSMMRMT